MKAIKNFLIFTGLLILDLVYSSLAVVLLSKIGLNINTLNAYKKSLILIIIELTFMLILYLIYQKELHKEFIKYIKNFGKYFIFGFKWWFIGLVIMSISNIIIGCFYEQSANEVAVQSIFKQMPLYMLFASCIAAPFCEEIIFRKSLRKWCPIDIVFILLSGLIFGGLHVLAGINQAGQLLYIIPYSTFGFIFGYMYVKTKNIFVSMTFHFIHNSILSLVALYQLGVF